MDDLIKRLHRGESCYIGTAASKLTAVDEYGLLCLEAAAAIAEAQAEIERLREALGDMVDLFSADNVLRKGTHLNATLKLARIAINIQGMAR